LAGEAGSSEVVSRAYRSREKSRNVSDQQHYTFSFIHIDALSYERYPHVLFDFREAAGSVVQAEGSIFKEKQGWQTNDDFDAKSGIIKMAMSKAEVVTVPVDEWMKESYVVSAFSCLYITVSVLIVYLYWLTDMTL